MITYTDKVQLTPNPNPDINQWKATDANEVKTEVNTDITNLSTHTSNTSNPHSVTATQVGLGNVDNTSDVNKPVSSATQTALNLKADITYVDTQDATKQPIDSDLTTIAGLTPSNDDFLQRKSGAWANRTVAQVQSDLGISSSSFSTVTGTDTLDSGDYNKTILCSGTSSDYTITLPTAVGITGVWFDLVGVTALTKIITIDGDGTEKINGILTRQFTGRGGFKLVSDGANWQVVAEKPSWILYTPSAFTGFSGTPPNGCKYSLNGKQMTIAYDVGAPTTASGTGLTFAIPTGYSGASSSSGYYQYARIFSNGSAVSTGMAHVNATNIECFLNGAGGAIASTSTKSAQGIITFDID